MPTKKNTSNTLNRGLVLTAGERNGKKRQQKETADTAKERSNKKRPAISSWPFQ